MSIRSLLNQVSPASAICVLLVLCLFGCETPPGDEPTLSIPFEHYTLDNGLDVILHEDHSDPIVAVSIQVHVGSAREQVGKTGFAHFFEHMSFNDSENVPQASNRTMIEEWGGLRNGGTNTDSTIYFEVVPKDAFERLLWIDSDRLGYMINTVTESALENEKQVVKNEKRQRVDNQPYGHTQSVILRNLYPEGHPYSWSVIGALEDLQAATLDDVRTFYERFYGPNNATLVIAGDIDPEETRALVDKWFGEIERGAEVDALQPRPAGLAETRSLYHVDSFARLPEIRLTFPTVEQFHPDSWALDALATILSQGKRAPLYRVIVEEEKLAPSVSAFHSAAEIAGILTIRVRANEGVELGQLKAAIDRALEDFDSNGFSEKDLERIKARSERQFYDSISSGLGKAFQLAAYNTFAGDPGFIAEDLARLKAVTAAEVIDVFERYVKDRPYVMTSFVPRGQESLVVPGATRAEVSEEKIVQGAEQAVAEDPNFEYVKTPASFDRSAMPALTDRPLLQVPEIWSAETDNGIRVVGIEQTELPLVEISLRINGGMLLEDMEKLGTASLLSELLMEGTRQRTPEELEDAIGELGARISLFAGREAITLRASTLARNYDQVLDLVAEILLEPRWDEVEFDRLKSSLLTRLEARQANPNAVASIAFSRLLYGDRHILGHPMQGTPETVARIDLGDLKTYYERYLSPAVATLHVAGSIGRDQVLTSLAALGTEWQSRPVVFPSYELPPPRSEPGIYFVDVPGAKQSVILVGRIALPGSDPDYNRLTFANNRLGGGSSARLFQLLRIEKGYTYGARSVIPRQVEPAPFLAQSSVRSNVTLESLQLFREQLRNYGKTFTQQDLETTQNLLIKQATREFETLFDLIGLLETLTAFDLPLDYIERDQREILGLSLADVQSTIARYMDESGMVYVVVGDAETQRERIAESGFGEPVALDGFGRPIG